MLRFYYQWRYRKRQKKDSLKLPRGRPRGNRGLFQDNLGSYLSQPSVRGRVHSKFDLPRKRKKRLRACLVLIAACMLIWLVAESVSALSLFRN